MTVHADVGPRRPRAERSGGTAVLAAWSAVALVLLVLQAWAGGDAFAVGVRWLDSWSQFDGPEYLAIAAEGYERRQLVWFPLYPLSIRVGSTVVDPMVAAVGISLLAGAAGASLCWRWLATTSLSAPARTTAMATILLYPYGWFLYGVVYADALFLAVAAGAFLAFERDRRLLAALSAALATATRPSGFAVVIGLAILTLERDGVLRQRSGATGWVAALRVPTSFDRGKLRPRTLWPIAGTGGLVAYGAYQWVAWGTPLAFMAEQENYHEPGTASLLKQQYFDAFSGGFDGRHLATTTFQAALLVAVVLAVPAVGRRFGWGYAAYVFCLALLPAISVSTFMGVGRYLLPAFPVYALAGAWLADRPRTRLAVLACSGSLMVLMAFGFARSWYLS